jgi:integrase
MTIQLEARGDLKIRRRRTPKVLLICDCGCGKQFLRYRNKIRPDRNFFSKQHFDAYVANEYLKGTCGSYLPIVKDFLEGYASLHYKDARWVRHSICPFFQFLSETSRESLRDVTPATITAFQEWAMQRNYRSAATETSALSTFFNWLIIEDHREDANPVVPPVHGKKKKPRVGKPYSDGELERIWDLLLARGNARLCAFAAIAQEAGLRISEICNLRLSDVDMRARTLFVGTPNKTERERYAFFSDKANTYLTKWLAERDSECGHDFLFHNRAGGRLLHKSIRDEFNRTLCMTYDGRRVNEDGLVSWSIHRMRHTMASTLINNGADAATTMAAGGWVSATSMIGYIEVDPEATLRGTAKRWPRSIRIRRRALVIGPSPLPSSWSRWARSWPFDNIACNRIPPPRPIQNFRLPCAGFG